MYSKIKYSYTLPLLFSIAVSIGMLIGYKLHSNMPISKNFFTNKDKNNLDEVIGIIQKRYVDNVNTDSSINLAIETILSSLDPHSKFIPASAIKEMNEDLEGQFEGIGIEFNQFDDTIHVLSVLKNGPSEKAGLMIGDKIIKVNDSIVIGLKNSDQFKKWVKGPSGSVVQLTILRNGRIINERIIRGSIPITSVDASYMIDKEIGYIRLNRFSVNTYREFMLELEKLNASGMKKLLLDLRDNGGGILEEAVNIADEFISDDKLLVYTQGANSPRKEYKAKRPGLFEEGKVILLLNENSASASEVLAGALQDHDRALIIGRKSFGKGLVQEQFTLSDGGALRLTTARYFTPLGRSIQKSYSEGSAQYHRNFISRLYNANSDSVTPNKSKAFKTLSGKVLYESDGIMPDIIVMRDETILDSAFQRVFEKNLLTKFSYRLFMKEKNKILQLKNTSELANYLINSNLMSELYVFAKGQGVNLPIFNKKQSAFLSNRIIAQIARISGGENAYYSFVNQKDELFRKAIASF